MIKLVLMNILLIVVIPTYIVYTQYGSLEYGDLYKETTVVFTVISLFLTVVILAANHKSIQENEDN